MEVPETPTEVGGFLSEKFLPSYNDDGDDGDGDDGDDQSDDAHLDCSTSRNMSRRRTTKP